jgi:dTDP-4-amino-4,6-dideoxygalactose transaminase
MRVSAPSPERKRVASAARAGAGWWYYLRARDGLGAVLDALARAGAGDGEVLPAYVGWSSREGSGIYDPIRSRGLPVSFYRMRDDLTVDVGEFAAAVQAASPSSVVLLVHYFGRPDPAAEELTALSRRRGLRLIEDAAHAYASAQALGSCGALGDAVIYSIHKLFQVPVGGVLQVNTRELASQLRRDDAASMDPPPWARVLDEEMTAHAAARVERYRWVAQALAPLAPALVPLWPELPSGTVPQSLPVRAAGTRLRDALYFGLRADGVAVASLYHTLIAPLTPEEFPGSHRLAGSLLNLPVAPWLTSAELERMAGCLADIVARERGHGDADRPGADA